MTVKKPETSHLYVWIYLANKFDSNYILKYKQVLKISIAATV